MNGPIFDNTGKQVAYREGMEVHSLDKTKSYDIDFTGNLLDRRTGKVVGHLIPAGQFLPDGRPSPGQDLF